MDSIFSPALAPEQTSNNRLSNAHLSDVNFTSLYPQTIAANGRPEVVGKQLQIDGNTFYIKGITYGTFPFIDGHQYPQPVTVANDFRRMVASSINTVRVYTVPPKWVLDLAQDYGLYLMVGIPWEQHIAILEDRSLVNDIKKRFRQAVRSCDKHPAILCYSIGNEIPASVVRWHGRKKVEKFLKSLYQLVKDEDSQALVTYVNFPTTEFLNLDFVDFYSFNVYLEDEDNLCAYLSRLQILSGDKPLVLAEVGLDSIRNGEAEQSQTLQWQLTAIYESGAAGCFVFAWTDEWFVGGRSIDDWKFGLTGNDRSPKPALGGVKQAYASLPFRESLQWPSINVVVCSYNGAATIEKTLTALANLDYPNYEVIVVNDGSTDATEQIAKQYPFKLISTVNEGLSSARNTGYRAGCGEIVVYIDDDAYPEREWLRYIALTYIHNDVIAVGGPNYPVPNDGVIADCVANAPGNPMEVMLTDDIAEHIPGCNMSFTRWALDAVGGFDTRFRTAGDDVDICWRVQELGDIGFQPAAFNWHHRRNSVSAYLKQQRGYGVAEALLEKKWPQKYSDHGHLIWQGRLYGQGLTRQLFKLRSRVYQGVWGCSPFQRLYNTTSPDILSLSVMPEWLIVIVIMAIGSAAALVLGASLLVLLPLVLATGIFLCQALVSAVSGNYDVEPQFSREYIHRLALTCWLHMAQPVVRLQGRLSHGLSPLRSKSESDKAVRLSLYKSNGVWDGKYQDSIERLSFIETELSLRTKCSSGNPYDNWDLQVFGGVFGSARLSLMVEHHGEHSEYVRYRVVQRWSLAAGFLLAVCSLFSLASLAEGSYIAACLSTLVLVLVAWKSLLDGSRAIALIENAIRKSVAEPAQEDCLNSPIADEATVGIPDAA